MTVRAASCAFIPRGFPRQPRTHRPRLFVTVSMRNERNAVVWLELATGGLRRQGRELQRTRRDWNVLGKIRLPAAVSTFGWTLLPEARDTTARAGQQRHLARPAALHLEARFTPARTNAAGCSRCASRLAARVDVGEASP